MNFINSSLWNLVLWLAVAKSWILPIRSEADGEPGLSQVSMQVGFSAFSLFSPIDLQLRKMRRQ